MTIGELADRAQSAIETIRFYEREGLLPRPVRSVSNYRLYAKPHLERLVFIRHCRLLDLSLDEIRTLLKLRDAPSESCREVDVVLDQHLAEVRERITELQRLQAQLKSLRARCASAVAVKDCRILNQLSGRGSKSTRERHGIEVHRKSG